MTEPVKTARTPAREPVRLAHLQPGQALNRRGEVVSRTRKANVDQFDFPAELKEEGWSYQWNRASCFGKPDIAEMSAMRANGWDFVSPNQLGGYYKNSVPAEADHIEIDGLVLMERPQTLTDEAKNEADRAAYDQYMKAFDPYGNEEEYGLIPDCFKKIRRQIVKELPERYRPNEYVNKHSANLIPNE